MATGAHRGEVQELMACDDEPVVAMAELQQLLHTRLDLHKFFSTLPPAEGGCPPLFCAKPELHTSVPCCGAVASPSSFTKHSGASCMPEPIGICCKADSAPQVLACPAGAAAVIYIN